VQSVNKPKTNQGQNELFKKGGNTMATKMNPGFMAMMAKKKDGTKKMAEGGKTDMAQDKAMMQKAVNRHEGHLHKGEPMTKLAKGGFSRTAGGKLPSGSKSFKGVKGSAVKSGLDAGNKSADGIAQRGKTRGDNIVMKRKGGKVC
jgi:hypothetical protein